MKNKTSDLLIQIISVTVGVFLGFVISNWSENSRESSKNELLVRNIVAEMKLNKSKVSDVIQYHKIVRDSSRYYLKNSSMNLLKPNFFKGVNTVTFDNSAYNTGIQTGLFSNLELEKIQAINRVYTQQRAYEDFSHILLSGLISLDFDENTASTRKIATFLSISMTDIVIKENQLLSSLNQALDLMEE